MMTLAYYSTCYIFYLDLFIHITNRKVSEKFHGKRSFAEEKNMKYCKSGDHGNGYLTDRLTTRALAFLLYVHNKTF
jgi:hypothetical protein